MYSVLSKYESDLLFTLQDIENSMHFNQTSAPSFMHNALQSNAYHLELFFGQDGQNVKVSQERAQSANWLN